MKWLFILAWLFLLAFAVEPVRTPPRGANHLVVWRLSEGTHLIRVFPQDVHVLFDRGVFYAYLDDGPVRGGGPYVSAVRVDTMRRHTVIDHVHLSEATQGYPAVLPYDPSSETLAEALESARAAISRGGRGD